MSVDYSSIRAENDGRYGWDIGRLATDLLANRYDDQAHFIFELLQNAEDALARREDGSKSRSVRFRLDENSLRFSHYGEPFDEKDVRSICNIAESTKEATSIGRFGIGFKSVYAVTDCPEIHSGDECFAIENYVWPRAASSVARSPDETVILLPLKTHDDAVRIARGIEHLGSRTLLFLRQIEEIEWLLVHDSVGFVVCLLSK